MSPRLRSGLRPHMRLHPVHYTRRVVLFFCSQSQYVMCHWTSMDVFTSFTRGEAFTLLYHHDAVTYFPHTEGHSDAETDARCRSRFQVGQLVHGEDPGNMCTLMVSALFPQITTAAIRRQHAEDTSCTSAFESWAGRYFLLLHVLASYELTK